MRIREETARKLLLALGFDNARTYSEAMLIKRLSEIETKVPQERLLKMKDEELMPSLKAVMSSAKRKEELVIVREEIEPKIKAIAQTTGNEMTKLKEREPAQALVSEINPEESWEAEPKVHEPKPKRLKEEKPERPKSKGDEYWEMRKEALKTVPPELPNEDEVFKQKFPALAAKNEEAMRKHLARQEAREQARKDAAEVFPFPKKDKKSYYKPVQHVNEFPHLTDTEKRPHKPKTVLRAIFNALLDATEDDPVTKDDIFRVVERKFPEGNRSSMWVSINAMPMWLEKHYPFQLNKVDKKYYLTPKVKK